MFSPLITIGGVHTHTLDVRVVPELLLAVLRSSIGVGLISGVLSSGQSFSAMPKLLHSSRRSSQALTAGVVAASSTIDRIRIVDICFIL